MHACRLNELRGLDPTPIHKAAAIPRADTRGAHMGHSAISCHCQLDRKPGKDPTGHPRGGGGPGAAPESLPGVSLVSLEYWAGDPPTTLLFPATRPGPPRTSPPASVVEAVGPALLVQRPN